MINFGKSGGSGSGGSGSDGGGSGSGWKIGASTSLLSWGTYKSFSVHLLGAISHAIRVSKPKNEMPTLGLNSSRGIKLSNLEASGHALSAVKNKP